MYWFYDDVVFFLPKECSDDVDTRYFLISNCIDVLYLTRLPIFPLSFLKRMRKQPKNCNNSFSTRNFRHISTAAICVFVIYSSACNTNVDNISFLLLIVKYRQPWSLVHVIF